MTPAQMAAEVLRLSEAARPAPWSIPATIPGKYRYVDAPDEDLVCGPLYTADAEFIAYTRTAAPAIAQALLDALERLATLETALAAVEAREDALVEALQFQRGLFMDVHGARLSIGDVIVAALDGDHEHRVGYRNRELFSAARAIVAAHDARTKGEQV